MAGIDREAGMLYRFAVAATDRQACFLESSSLISPLVSRAQPPRAYEAQLDHALAALLLKDDTTN
jgi:hypothetical protein